MASINRHSDPDLRMELFLAQRELRANFTPFTRHGTHKHLQSSTRRPGNHTANKFPSCTTQQAKTFDERWIPIPARDKLKQIMVDQAGGRLGKSQPALQNLPIKTELGTEIRRKFTS